MNGQEGRPNWLQWVWQDGLRRFLVVFILLLLVMVGVAIYLEGRIGEMEDRLQSAPPRIYQPPNLDDYRADDVVFGPDAATHTVYVPVYSHIYLNGGSPCLLETTLSIRNVDRERPVYIKSVEYFNTDGKPVKNYLDGMIKLAPLQTIDFLVEQRDSRGGSGANFLVDWVADAAAQKPLVEAVMVGVTGARGVCFARSGIELSATATPATDPQ